MRVRALALSIGLALLASCGVKAPPEPPRLPSPEPPERVKVRVREGAVELVWKAPEIEGEDHVPATMWEVLRAPEPPPGEGPPYIVIDRLEKNSYTDSTLPIGAKAVYSIRGVSAEGRRGDPSKPVRVFHLEDPLKPASVSAAAGDRFAEIAWTIPQDFPPEAGFNIYRAKDPALFPWIPLNLEPLTQTFYVDGPLENDIRYFYEIRAVIVPDGYPPVEGPSALISVVPNDKVPPAPPENFIAVWTDLGVQMRWMTNQDDDLDGYVVVRRKRGVGDFQELFIDPIRETSYIDKTARKGIEYEYAVYAVDKNQPPNRSGYSNTQVVYAEPGD